MDIWNLLFIAWILFLSAWGFMDLLDRVSQLTSKARFAMLIVHGVIFVLYVGALS